MNDSAKYLIHADIRASGVVERSDVVGAVFGQTEGLLGDGLDLRDLQESGKLGRIDVEVESERGSSFGEITIASALDRVETAILAAALESIERVGPCRADVEIATIEDVRSAKRREIVERAKELVAEFDEAAAASDDLIEEVRRSVRVADITEYRGLPAGPRVADSDAVVVVEGRADVQTLLGYGIKNAVAVEGTDVPEAVAELTADRTVTAFLDGDRGGDLILKELAQVGDVDYVALAPPEQSVEDLSREDALRALREKVPFETVSEERPATGRRADSPEAAATDGSARPAPSGRTDDVASPASGPADPGVEGGEPASPTDAESPERPGEPTDAGSVDGAEAGEGTEKDERTEESERIEEDERTEESEGNENEVPDGTDGTDGTDDEPQTLAGHVEAVIADGSGQVRLLDGDQSVLAEGPADAAFDLVESAEAVPASVVLDGEVTQRLLDVSAQRGVEQVVGASAGEFVKQPATVRVRTAAEF